MTQPISEDQAVRFLHAVNGAIDWLHKVQEHFGPRWDDRWLACQDECFLEDSVRYRDALYRAEVAMTAMLATFLSRHSEVYYKAFPSERSRAL